MKDQYLINFLKRLQEKCPLSWKRDLDNLYGLNDLVDDVGTVTSQFDDDWGTQQIETQSGYHTRTNFRLLNDLPVRSRNEPSLYPEGIQRLSKEIIKKKSLQFFRILIMPHLRPTDRPVHLQDMFQSKTTI